MGTQINRNDIAIKLKALLVQEFGLSESSLASDDLHLVGEGSGIDSVGVLRLVMTVEKVFGIVIGDSDVSPENFQTLQGLVSLIERKLI